MIFLTLFSEFFKTGLFAVGGGLATIPFLYKISDKYSWFTYEELSNMIAISESTPGPIGVNMATYSGFISGFSNGGTLMGWCGSIVAALGLITPSVIIILIIAGFLKKFQENEIVKSFFGGLRPAVAGLILVASYEVFKVSLFNGNFDIISWLVFGALLFVSLKWRKIHPVFIIISGAILGIIIGGVRC